MMVILLLPFASIDDIIVTGTNIEEIQCITTRLHSTFHIKNIGNLMYFLGLQVARNSNGIHPSQRKYVLDLLYDTDMLDGPPVNTPRVPKPSSYPTNQPLNDIAFVSHR